MPVSFEHLHSPYRNRRGTEVDPEPDRCITIGLINNMPDSALRATERQFLSLLDSASAGMPVRLRLYSLPGVTRSESVAPHMAQFYSSLDGLWDAQIDGLIVTGREPTTTDLTEEPYWESFTEVLDWASDHTYASVWSCLAAHAAVLFKDGIGRIRSNEKHCGVFPCNRVADHPLLTGTPSCFSLPHSRWNGLPEAELEDCGYRVLTCAEGAGVDTFIQQQKSLFVFFQGHPEYQADTLLLEYGRDAGRYIRGETSAYPSIPHRYFDPHTTMELTALQHEMMSCSGEGLLAKLSTILRNARAENTWRSTAICIYRNWLEYIDAQKKRRSRGHGVPVQAY